MPSEPQQTHYELLGVPRDATDAQIGKAFMRAMRSAHPDQHAAEGPQARADAEEHARRLTEAHAVLTGPDRADYDARLDGAAGPGGSEGPGDDGSVPTTPPAPAAGVPTARPDDDLLAPVQDAVLPLTRARWERGGTLVPNGGGRPVRVPARTENGQVLVFEGRGAPTGDGGPAGDLHVRVVHVDRRGKELDDGHGSGASTAARLVRGLSPVQAGILAFGLTAVLALLVGLLALD